MKTLMLELTFYHSANQFLNLIGQEVLIIFLWHMTVVLTESLSHFKKSSNLCILLYNTCIKWINKEILIRMRFLLLNIYGRILQCQCIVIKSLGAF